MSTLRKVLVDADGGPGRGVSKTPRLGNNAIPFKNFFSVGGPFNEWILYVGGNCRLGLSCGCDVDQPARADADERLCINDLPGSRSLIYSRQKVRTKSLGRLCASSG